MFKSLPTFVVERSPMSLDLETCWKVLQFPLLVLQAMWGHSFQSPHAIFTLGDVLDVYRSLLQSAPFNFESKSKLQGVMLNLTATCFRGRSNFCDHDERAYDYLTSPIRLALDFDTHDERTLYRFATHTTDGISGYASLTSQAAINVFTMGVEKFHWHHPSFNESAVRHLVPFPTAVDHVLRVLVSLSDIKSHVLLKGPRGCGKRVTMIIVSGILSYKYVEIRQTAFHVLKQTLMIVGTTATNHIIYVAVDELSTDMRHVIMHVVCDGDIPWSLYEAHELDDIADAMKKLPSLQHLNPSKAQCYSLYRDNLKKYVHLALSIRNNPVVVDACVDDNTSLLHTCSVHIFSPWSVDCFEAILTATSVPPLLHPVMLHIHASVLAAQPTLPRLNRLNSTAAFKMFVKTDGNVMTYVIHTGLKHMKELIREIDQLNARERKLAKAVEVVGAKSDELHRRYEKQRVIEGKLHEAFAEEDRAYQVMKRAIDDEKRSLQDELDQTVPEIQAAIISLNKINKLHITEMKSFTSPPDLVRLVMQAVCVLLGLGATPTWDDALFVLCDMRFLDRLKYFDKDNIQDSVMRKLDKFIKHPKFNEDEMKRASIASTSLCRWVLAMVRYHTVMTYVRPKQAKLETAHGHVCAVRAATDAWKVCETKTKALHAAWTESEQKKGHMQTELLHVRERTTSVDRISIVFENLKPLLRKQLHDVKCADDTLIGDCLVLAATAAYLKTVVPSQRVPLVDMWTEQCAAASFRTSPNMLESTLGMEGVQELRAACALSDMQILINLSHLHRITKLPMDVVHEQSIAQISNHVTAAFVREALHSLPSELHLGFCCYVALGICAYNEREIVAICKAQLTAFRNSSFPGVHVMADQSSPTVTHAVASRVITSAIRTCVDRIVVKKAASTTHAIHMADILDGSARVYIARDGNKRRLCTVQLLSKWQLVFQHTMGITFADLVDDVDCFPQDLHHINASEKAELGRQFQAIAHGDITVNANFRLWVIHDAVDALFPACNVKTYFFNTTTVMMPRCAKSQANGSTFHSKYRLGLVLFHLLVANGLHAGSPTPSTQFSMYELEQADYLLCTLCDEKDVAPGIQAEDWTPAQVASILAPLYKSKTADVMLGNQYDVLYRTTDPMLHRGFVAEWMLAKYAAPFRLRDWVAWVQASVSMYQEWLWSLRFPLIRLQACQNPKALLMATLEQYAMAFDVPVCDVCFAALSHPPECSQTSTPSIQLGHLYFRWDGSQLNLLTDDDNDHGGTALIHRSKPIEYVLSCSVHDVHVFAWVRKDLHPDTTYKCPVYTYYFTHLTAGISWDTPIASAHVTSIYLPIPTHSDPQYHAKGVVCVLNEAFQPTHPVT
ncbi:hypothetical protein DYB37_007294 [Aphanomyces astaci]|uniref:Dynein heavy chain coiled coil stalk domain-containing protein n=1 Tax=Aphanomyces astaci TaxID=112090 RepID=A0A418ETQ9_APHAT|nr:hypothetical protein DYB37_007294 [Aphanomyces astaci]